MTTLNQVYKCEVCGNIVEVTHASKGQLVCCGQPMKLLEPNTVDAVVEKHVPVVEKTDKGILVKVGSVQHPMTEEHYIEWIEVISENAVYRKNLKPGDAPEAEFCVTDADIQIRAYCNLHGLWQDK